MTSPYLTIVSFNELLAQTGTATMHESKPKRSDEDDPKRAAFVDGVLRRLDQQVSVSVP